MLYIPQLVLRLNHQSHLLLQQMVILSLIPQVLLFIGQLLPQFLNLLIQSLLLLPILLSQSVLTDLFRLIDPLFLAC